MPKKCIPSSHNMHQATYPHFQEIFGLDNIGFGHRMVLRSVADKSKPALIKTNLIWTLAHSQFSHKPTFTDCLCDIRLNGRPLSPRIVFGNQKWRPLPLSGPMLSALIYRKSMKVIQTIETKLTEKFTRIKNLFWRFNRTVLASPLLLPSPSPVYK